MNELHLFAGAGGGILAGQLLGHQCVCAVEWEPYAAAVLAQRQNDGLLPPFPIWDDVRTFDGRPWRGVVDVVAGGFPCQAFSAATRGRVVAEDLWPEMRRIVADVAPPCVFAENVSERAIEAAADDLEAMGYQVKCIALSAADVGADHIRKRFWLLAHAYRDSEFLRSVHAKTPELRGLDRDLWSREPRCVRVPDGLAGRLDRLEAAGNGQVPLCAAEAFRMLAAQFG